MTDTSIEQYQLHAVGQTRYLLVYLDADSTGDGYGKNASVSLYALDDRERGERLAEWLVERDIDTAQAWGGYPGKAWVIDLHNPGTAFSQISDLQAEYDEWQENNAEEQ